ncbi:hypothetical protein WK99_18320 [Burkholderia ubonensis]|nr:hypothetical protein WK99_18320 [Burkholderia ubonensis]
MRKIREVLRLHFECGRNQREIAEAVGTSTTTVWQYLRRTRLVGLSWPLPAELQTNDAVLPLAPPPTSSSPLLYAIAETRTVRTGSQNVRASGQV